MRKRTTCRRPSQKRSADATRWPCIQGTADRPRHHLDGPERPRRSLQHQHKSQGRGDAVNHDAQRGAAGRRDSGDPPLAQTTARVSDTATQLVDDGSSQHEGCRSSVTVDLPQPLVRRRWPPAPLRRSCPKERSSCASASRELSGADDADDRRRLRRRATQSALVRTAHEGAPSTMWSATL